MKKLIPVFLIFCLTLCLLATSAAEMDLPAKLEAIEAGAFDGDASITGVVTLPEGVTAIGSRAFAGTSVHALVLPSSCTQADTDLLSGTGAAYAWVTSADTTLADGALDGAHFLFAPKAHTGAKKHAHFYAIEQLVEVGNILYYHNGSEMYPLCVKDPQAVPATVTLPKFIDGCPVASTAYMITTGMENMRTLNLPEYLSTPAGADDVVMTYPTMTAEFTAHAEEINTGVETTFTLEMDGVWGEASYSWLFDVNGALTSKTTTEPTVTFTPDAEGECTVTVSVIDELGDYAYAETSLSIVNPVVYRALLIGNTYPGTADELPGPDNDVAAMRTMLGSMKGTPVAITGRINVSASQIQSAIQSTLGAADSNDVSIFYYSGHGTSSGALVGTSSTYVTVATLRQWLDQVPGTKIVLLDCCHSGSAIGKSDTPVSSSAFNSAVISAFSAIPRGDSDLASGGYVVMTACTQKQTSASLGLDYNNDQEADFWFGAFTYGLCLGNGYNMLGENFVTLSADANGDGRITLGEAYSSTVRTVTDELELEQSTQYYGDNSFVLWIK